MEIRISKTCIENHGVANRIDWALDILRKEMEKNLKEYTTSTYVIKAEFPLDEVT